MSVKKLIEAHEWFYDEIGFVWKSDQERLNEIDRWQILTLVMGYFVGDCEDAALTIMNKLLSMGVDPSKLFIIRCATEVCKPSKAFDHAILVYIDDNDEWYFSDNRYIQYPACDLRSLRSYKLFDMVSIDNLRGIGKPKLISTVMK